MPPTNKTRKSRKPVNKFDDPKWRKKVQASISKSGLIRQLKRSEEDRQDTETRYNYCIEERDTARQAYQDALKRAETAEAKVESYGRKLEEQFSIIQDHAHALLATGSTDINAHLAWISEKSTQGDAKRFEAASRNLQAAYSAAGVTSIGCLIDWINGAKVLKDVGITGNTADLERQHSDQLIALYEATGTNNFQRLIEWIKGAKMARDKRPHTVGWIKAGETGTRDAVTVIDELGTQLRDAQKELATTKIALSNAEHIKDICNRQCQSEATARIRAEDELRALKSAAEVVERQRDELLKAQGTWSLKGRIGITDIDTGGTIAGQNARPTTEQDAKAAAKDINHGFKAQYIDPLAIQFGREWMSPDIEAVRRQRNHYQRALTEATAELDRIKGQGTTSAGGLIAMHQDIRTILGHIERQTEASIQMAKSVQAGYRSIQATLENGEQSREQIIEDAVNLLANLGLAPQVARARILGMLA